MANFEAEITEITIESTGYGHTDVEAERVEGKEYIKVKIDELTLNIDLYITMALIFELAKVLKFELTDLENNK